jgi:hypothetical protein
MQFIGNNLNIGFAEQMGSQANLSYHHYQGDAVVTTFIKAIQHDLQKR